RNIAHTRLRPRLAEIPENPLVVHCQTGERATGASAFLARNGYEVTCVADKMENAPQVLR
ncbi:MAG: rhodanese-like domain-containing protein, partial [Spartobacteria bacterium]